MTEWSPAGAVPSGSIASSLPVPEGFPAGIALYQQSYANWSKEIVLDSVWTCSPADDRAVVTIVEWALAHGYTVRPRGAMHGWTPLTVVTGSNVDKVLLVDTTSGLDSIAVDTASTPATVTAGAGATLMAILTELEQHGLGWTSVPAPAVLTIAGALAVDAHGAALPARGESRPVGAGYGSLSNLVTALTAVVWNDASGTYELQSFRRSDPEILPLLTHLGRAFITSVTLAAHVNVRMRCQSFVDIALPELFAPGGSSGRTYESFVAESGRAEAIWFPYTDFPWMKVWTPIATKPDRSVEVNSAYNYTFSDNLPEPVTDVLGRLQLGAVDQAPAFGRLQFAAAQAGLVATQSSDIWGWSKNVQFYIRATTIRLCEGGGAVITSRANIGRVVHEFITRFSERIAYFQSIGQYPINGPVEIRCCGLDTEADVDVPSAGSPTLSALRPRADHPDWDTAIWLNILAIPQTPGMYEFYREIQEWMIENYSGDYATFRPEWSKGWAFTDQASYADREFITETIPHMYREGYPTSDNWDSAAATFDRFDPHRIFTNSFIDELLP